MIINREEYMKKVLGAWMGKNIGGTIGAPFEWKRQVNDVSFYTQKLGGEPLPNDDLDIQLLWLIALEEKGVNVDAKLLGEYWLMYVTPFWVEYGTAKLNMRMGLVPPLSGSYNNLYKDSCGAYIRSEIWACIAPGFPHIAARYALQDAMIDHGNGEGTYAEVFTAALESAAFVETNIHELIRIGLSYIPGDCGVAGAINNVIESHRKGKTWLEARNELLTHFRGKPQWICEEDRERGFADGKLGWDVPSNIGIVILGLLYGAGDFGKTICTAVNCGEDTDCTAASLGAILGIINGIDGIESKWVEPIGHRIRTGCLNLGDLGHYGSQLPATVEELTERTEKITQRMIINNNLPLEISSSKSTDLGDLEKDSLLGGADAVSLYRNLSGPTYSFDFFDVVVDYGEEPAVANAGRKTIVLRIKNTHRIQAYLNIRWYVPEGWQVRPDSMANLLAWQVLGEYQCIEFTLEREKVPAMVNRFVVEITMPDRHTAMLVPITLINENVVAVSG